MARYWKIVLGGLVVAVVVGLIVFPSLSRRIRRLAQSQRIEEQARREVLSPPITTPTDVTVQANLFWATGPDQVAPVAVQLPLSADPVQRSKQVLRALIASAPTAEQRTLPPDTELLGFYILGDGTAVVDFSDALTSEIPSGILSEQLVLDSITKTLENNVASLRRLKILIHGQEVDTLAGHVDLTGFFDLNPPSPPAAADSSAAPSQPSAQPQPSNAAAPLTTPAAPAPAPAVSPAARPGEKQ